MWRDTFEIDQERCLYISVQDRRRRGPTPATECVGTPTNEVGGPPQRQAAAATFSSCSECPGRALDVCYLGLTVIRPLLVTCKKWAPAFLQLHFCISGATFMRFWTSAAVLHFCSCISAATFLHLHFCSTISHTFLHFSNISQYFSEIAFTFQLRFWTSAVLHFCIYISAATFLQLHFCSYI